MNVVSEDYDPKPLTLSVLIPFFGDDLTDLICTLCSLEAIETDFSWEVVIAYETQSVPPRLTEIVNRISDFAVRIIVVSPGIGLAESLNIGVKESDSEFIARLDAGDTVYNAKRFELQVKFLSENPGVWCVGTAVRLTSVSGQFLRERHYPLSHDEIIFEAYKTNPLAHPTVLFRREVFRKLGGYDPSQYNEDLDLWLKSAAAGYELRNLPEATTNYVLTSTASGRSRSFWNALSIRLRHQKSLFLVIVISFPMAVVMSTLFKFPSLFYWLNAKAR